MKLIEKTSMATTSRIGKRTDVIDIQTPAESQAVTFSNVNWLRGRVSPQPRMNTFLAIGDLIADMSGIIRNSAAIGATYQPSIGFSDEMQGALGMASLMNIPGMYLGFVNSSSLDKAYHTDIQKVIIGISQLTYLSAFINNIGTALLRFITVFQTFLNTDICLKMRGVIGQIFYPAGLISCIAGVAKFSLGLYQSQMLQAKLSKAWKKEHSVQDLKEGLKVIQSYLITTSLEVLDKYKNPDAKKALEDEFDARVVRRFREQTSIGKNYMDQEIADQIGQFLQEWQNTITSAEDKEQLRVVLGLQDLNLDQISNLGIKALIALVWLKEEIQASKTRELASIMGSKMLSRFTEPTSPKRALSELLFFLGKWETPGSKVHQKELIENKEYVEALFGDLKTKIAKKDLTKALVLAAFVSSVIATVLSFPLLPALPILQAGAAIFSILGSVFFAVVSGKDIYVSLKKDRISSEDRKYILISWAILALSCLSVLIALAANPVTGGIMVVIAVSLLFWLVTNSLIYHKELYEIAISLQTYLKKWQERFFSSEQPASDKDPTKLSSILQQLEGKDIATIFSIFADYFQCVQNPLPDPEELVDLNAQALFDEYYKTGDKVFQMHVNDALSNYIRKKRAAVKLEQLTEEQKQRLFSRLTEEELSQIKAHFFAAKCRQYMNSMDAQDVERLCRVVQQKLQPASKSLTDLATLIRAPA